MADCARSVHEGHNAPPWRRGGTRVVPRRRHPLRRPGSSAGNTGRSRSGERARAGHCGSQLSPSPSTQRHRRTGCGDGQRSWAAAGPGKRDGMDEANRRTKRRTEGVRLDRQASQRCGGSTEALVKVVRLRTTARGPGVIANDLDVSRPPGQALRSHRQRPPVHTGWDCQVTWQFYFQFFKESPHCSPQRLY